MEDVMGKSRNTTINADFNRVDIVEGKLHLSAWRGQERITLKLAVSDWSLWHIAGRLAELAVARKQDYLEKAQSLTTRMVQAVEKIKA
jgi:hypothetical protein